MKPIKVVFLNYHFGFFFLNSTSLLLPTRPSCTSYLLDPVPVLHLKFSKLHLMVTRHQFTNLLK